MSGKTEAASRHVLEDLLTRGLKAPELLIVDGSKGPGGGAGPPMTNANDVLSGRLFVTDFPKISISCSFPISLTREGRPKGFHIVFSFRLSLSPEKGRLVLAEMLSHNSLKILRLVF